MLRSFGAQAVTSCSSGELVATAVRCSSAVAVCHTFRQVTRAPAVLSEIRCGTVALIGCPTCNCNGEYF